jgi:hypothetical protein
MEELMSDQLKKNHEVKFEPKSSVSMFGAPLSWVALFGSLIGAFSVIPMSFYTSGGGFMSAGMGIFAPVAGMILGPWAGFVAGSIGGLIGLMILPSAYPMGLLDILLSGSIMPLCWGFFIPKYYKWLLIIFPINAVIYLIVPYYYPGYRIGLSPPIEPYYSLSRHAAILSIFVFFLFCKKFMRMMESPNVKTHIIGLMGITYLANAMWVAPWSWPYTLLFRIPLEPSYVTAYLGWFNHTIPIVAATTTIGYFLMNAVRKGKLKVVKDSWLDGYNLQVPI